MNPANKYLYLLGFALNIYLRAISQNYIDNGGFEKYYNYVDQNNVVIYHPESWFYKPNGEDHPIYFSCDRYRQKGFAWNIHPDSSLISQGYNINYISVLIMPVTQRAYTELVEPLKKGALYRISMDLKPSTQSNCLSDVIIGFLNDTISGMDTILNEEILKVTEPADYDSVYNRWMNVSCVFAAAGYEKVLILFAGKPQEYSEMVNSNPEKFRIVYNGSPWLKYYVDNIVLSEVEENTLSTGRMPDSFLNTESDKNNK